MYGYPPSDLLVIRVFNNTDKKIKDISFNYEGSKMRDTTISSIRPRQDKQTGISTIYLNNPTDILMHHKVDGNTFTYVIKEKVTNSFTTKQVPYPIRISINDIKENGELDISIKVDEA